MKFTAFINGHPREIEAGNPAEAAMLVFQLMAHQPLTIVDIQTDAEVITYELSSGEAQEIDRYPRDRLVEVKVVVRVPMNEDLDEFLKQSHFSCMNDGMDLYERVDGYRILPDQEV